MEYCYIFKLLSLDREMEIVLAKNKNLNNPKGKEKVSNMIKVASLTRKGFIAGDISTVMSPQNCTSLG